MSRTSLIKWVAAAAIGLAVPAFAANKVTTTANKAPARSTSLKQTSRPTSQAKPATSSSQKAVTRKATARTNTAKTKAAHATKSSRNTARHSLTHKTTHPALQTRKAAAKPQLTLGRAQPLSKRPAQVTRSTSKPATPKKAPAITAKPGASLWSVPGRSVQLASAND